MKKPLRWVGLALLVAWTGLGVFAWARFGDRVEVTISERVEDGTDRTALLADRVDLLAADLDALVRSLDENFRRLGDALEERPAGDAAADRARQFELDARLAKLERGIDGLRAELADALVVRSTAETAPTANPAPPPEPEPETVVVEEPAPAAEPEPARNFLAFELPSRDLRFEGPQTFELLEDLSRVGFDAKSTLHDFSGASNRVSGRFRVDLARAGAGIEGRVEIASASLLTGLEARDEVMREQLAAEEFETIAFEPTGFEPAAVDAQAMRLSGKLRGRMTIRGATREVALDVTAHVDESRRLVVEGELPLRLSSFDVEAPRKLGVISMDDEVRVWIHLRARARSVPGATAPIDEAVPQ